MRTLGRIFKRSWKKPDGTVAVSPNYSIALFYDGRERVESAKTESEVRARALLRRRIEEMSRGEFKPSQDKVYLRDLLDLLKADYRNNNQRSLQDALWKITPLSAYFEGWKVKAITYDRISAYTQFRLGEKVATATVNGELRYLRRMLRLGIKHGKIATMPIVELLKGEARRSGFIDPADFANLLQKLDDTDVLDLVELLYLTGWRLSTGLGLEWRDVNLQAGTITMRAELSKNKEPMVLPFFANLGEIIERRQALRRLDCPFVFHRNGRRVKDFRAEWAKATRAAGRTGLLVHDLCRSAARNLSRAGVSETVASKVMNRKTLAIYKLYRVVDTEDLRIAGQALDGYLQIARKAAMVVSVCDSLTQNSHRVATDEAATGNK